MVNGQFDTTNLLLI